MAVSLKVEERATRPRSIRNKLRHEGKVPAVVNGYKIESTPISINWNCIIVQKLLCL